MKIRFMDVGTLTQVEVAEKWNVHRSRVQQIENRALAKLRKAIEQEAEAAGVSVLEWLEGDYQERGAA